MAVGRASNLRPPRMGVGDFGLSLGINYLQYKTSGYSKGGAMLAAFGETMLEGMFGPKFPMIFFGMQALGTIAPVAYRIGRASWYDKVSKYYNAGLIGGRYVDTQAAYTMRQSAVQAIQESKVYGRLAFGREASFMHR